MHFIDSHINKLTGNAVYEWSTIISGTAFDKQPSVGWVLPSAGGFKALVREG